VERTNLSIKRDSRGYMFSLDLLLALIPITIVLGMVAGDIDNMMYQVQDTVFRGSMDRVAFDAMDTLLETSGTPTNWEETGNPSVVGLATYDSSQGPVEGTIDTTKLTKLKDSDINNIIGPDYGFFLNITTADGKTKIKSFGNFSDNAPDRVRVERVALYSYLDVVSSAKNLMRFRGNENRTYTSPPNPFSTDQEDLEIFDYWVIVKNTGYDSATVSINSQRVVSPDQINQHVPLLISQINETVLKNDTAPQDNPVTVWVASTPGSTLDVYIVKVPQGLDRSYVTLDNVQPIKCRVALYVWPAGG
jgi:hypothetical protein